MIQLKSSFSIIVSNDNWISNRWIHYGKQWSFGCEQSKLTECDNNIYDISFGPYLSNTGKNKFDTSLAFMTA